MCRFLGIVAVALVLSVPARSARAQAFVGGPYTTGPYRVSDYFAAPGLYGTSYGFASYGVPRTFTTFSAYPGPSYGSNYPSYGLMPGRYGVGLWRPGFVAPGYVYGPAHFQHFLPYLPGGLRYRPERQPDRSASLHRRICAGARSRNRALRPVIWQSTGSARPLRFDVPARNSQRRGSASAPELRCPMPSTEPCPTC